MSGKERNIQFSVNLEFAEEGKGVQGKFEWKGEGKVKWNGISGKRFFVLGWVRDGSEFEFGEMKENPVLLLVLFFSRCVSQLAIGRRRTKEWERL